MASRRIEDLRPEFRVKVGYFLDLCQKAGLDILIYCTLRSLAEQAQLYRQGRTLGQIMRMSTILSDLYQRPDITKILQDVGPQYGPLVTNSAPGQSLHNYGLALDAAPLQCGKLIWAKDDVEDPILWAKYGAAARTAGLEWAGDWKRFKEMPHVQLPGVDWETLIRPKV